MANLVHRDINKLVADAAAHHAAGRLCDAEKAYRSALELAPDDPALTQNLGVLAATRGDPLSAIAYFDAAIAARPHFVAAHVNRAVALEALGRAQEAIQGFARAAALDPAHYEAHRALGFAWLAQGQRGRALDHFARTYELRRGDDRTTIALKSLTTATRDKLEHDSEQFLYLSQRTRQRLRFEQLARRYRSVADRMPDDSVATLSEVEIEMLGEDYNTPIHLRAAPEIADGAVNARGEFASLTTQFEGQGAVAVDDLLTPQALDALQRFLLESTIWHDFSHIDGFVASYLEDGLACPLLLQIADELRRAFPDILGPHPLSQAWAFKGLRTQSAVDVHADDAAVSINFWVTPAEANLDPAHGGLVVALTPPPDDWELRDYDADQERIVTFLEKNAGNSLLVPYRQNRALLFRSRLFHHSDRPKFAPGYENHRINLTLLYGR